MNLRLNRIQLWQTQFSYIMCQLQYLTEYTVLEESSCLYLTWIKLYNSLYTISIIDPLSTTKVCSTDMYVMYTICMYLNLYMKMFPEPPASSIFNYERFFKGEIDKKKADHTYRIFKKVSRRASEFPVAEEHTKGTKEITVWCSNDYLGMSWHPAVQAAVVWVFWLLWKLSWSTV